MLELTIRLVASLAIVIGLLLLLARLGARRFNGSAKAMVHVMHRQQLSKGSSVAVVSVGTRVLVLGTTEHQVSVLAELDPSELDEIAGLEEIEQIEQGPLQLTGAAGASDALPLDELIATLTPKSPVPADLSADLPDGQPGHAARDREHPPGARRRALAVVPTERRTVGKHALEVPATTGPLAGSILSPQTWRSALAAATRGA